MLRLTRLTDYGILLLTHFARRPERIRSARELSHEARLPQPTVSKLLKILAHHRLLEAHRGVNGGFRLARRPEQIHVADIVMALEGPIAVTECSEDRGNCWLEPTCLVRSNWRRLNRVVLEALRGVSLAEMTHPLMAARSPQEVKP